MCIYMPYLLPKLKNHQKIHEFGGVVASLLIVGTKALAWKEPHKGKSRLMSRCALDGLIPPLVSRAFLIN